MRKGHSKKLTLLSSCVASKSLAFSLTKVLVSEVPAILKKFVSKEVTLGAAILSCTWQPGCVKATSFCLTWNWRQVDRPATDLTFFTRSAKCTFLSNYYSLRYLYCYMYHFRSLEHVWLKILLHRSRAGIIRQNSIQNLLDRMASRKCGLAAEHCSKSWQQCWILGFSQNFIRKICTLETETSVSG